MTARPPSHHLNAQGVPKRGYASRGEAFAEARRTSRFSLAGQVEPYLCPECDRWHIGHRQPDQGLNRARR